MNLPFEDLPSWVIIFAAIIWILKQVGFLNWISQWLKFKQDVEKDKLEHIQDIEQKKSVSAAELSRMGNLKQNYIESWLLEQLTTNTAEAMSQVEEANDFIRSAVNEKLDLVVENNQNILLMLKEMENLKKTLGFINSELDVVNRRLEDK